MRAIAVAVVAGLLAVAGCSGGDCAGKTAEIGLGDLDTGFQPMADGDDVMVVLGPQGLNMIVVSVRVDSMDPGEHHVTVEVDHSGDLVAGAVADIVPEESPPDPAAYFLGLRVVFAVDEVRPLDGQLADVTATVTDACGDPVVATRSVRLRL